MEVVASVTRKHDGSVHFRVRMCLHHRGVVDTHRLYEWILARDSCCRNLQRNRMDRRDITVCIGGDGGQHDSRASIFPQKDGYGAFSGNCLWFADPHLAVSAVETAIRHRAAALAETGRWGAHRDYVRPGAGKVQVAIRHSSFLRESTARG